MLANRTVKKYKTPYKGPFMITQCFTNGVVNLQCGPKKISIIYVGLSYINQILELKILVQ